ncbi:MAG: aminotransferase class IV, partial [Leptospirales bacterium]
EIEKYPTLFQMTSTIDGTLKREISMVDLFTALFPGGSITGAPKRDAIRYISQLENRPRGVYTGAVGFFAPDGESIFNIAIRTLRIRDHHVRLGIGSGVVYDSSAENEYKECLLKSKFVTDAVEQKSFLPYLIETFRYSGGRYRFLKDHLKRMKLSAKTFGIPFSEERILAALEQDQQGEGVFRTRVELSISGEISMEHLPFTNYIEGKTCQVGISEKKVSSASDLLQHKTSLRFLFEKELKKAVANGWADVLFFNEKGFLTQGCVHNVFLKKGGRWLTPALENGLLPGVMRARLLQKFSPVFECNITLDDIKRTECVILCNSLRGIRRSTLVF